LCPTGHRPPANQEADVPTQKQRFAYAVTVRRHNKTASGKGGMQAYNGMLQKESSQDQKQAQTYRPSEH